MNRITLEFLDGTSVAYDFPPQAESPAARRMKLEMFLKSSFVVIECEGRAFLYPVNNIKCVTVEGSADGPDFTPAAIHGAVLVA